MTTFIHEPDGAGEPTIWVLENGDTDNYRYTALFRRVDLTPDERRWWPDVVARMTGTTITNDDATGTGTPWTSSLPSRGVPHDAEPDITDEWRAGLLTFKCQACNEDNHDTGVPHD
jgi:hypothetical protein